MRPVRTVAAVMFAAAVALTGCAAQSSADRPSPAAEPATAAAQPAQAPASPPKAPVSPARTSTEQALVLADGRHDAYVRRVDLRGHRLVIDLVQVFHDQAAVDAAVADGTPRDNARFLSTYIRNQNPRLRTLPLAGNAQVQLRGVDCEAPTSTKLSELARHASANRGQYYYALTVTGGTVQRIQELLAVNAC